MAFGEVEYAAKLDVEGVAHEESEFCMSRLRIVGYNVAINDFGNMVVADRQHRMVATIPGINRTWFPVAMVTALVRAPRCLYPDWTFVPQQRRYA